MDRFTVGSLFFAVCVFIAVVMKSRKRDSNIELPGSGTQTMSEQGLLYPTKIKEKLL